VRHFDPRLFDLLYDLTASLGDSGGEIDVICGYRTPRSNEFLRTRSAHTGVARHSLHMQAEAIDIRLPEIPISELRDAAPRFQRGGVDWPILASTPPADGMMLSLYYEVTTRGACTVKKKLKG